MSVWHGAVSKEIGERSDELAHDSKQPSTTLREARLTLGRISTREHFEGEPGSMVDEGTWCSPGVTTEAAVTELRKAHMAILMEIGRRQGK